MLNNVGILHYMVGAMIFEICSARDGSFKCFSSLFHLFHLNRNITWKCHCGAAITSDENKFNDRNVHKGESTLECCTKLDESFGFGDDLCRFDYYLLLSVDWKVTSLLLEIILFLLAFHFMRPPEELVIANRTKLKVLAVRILSDCN